MKGRVGSPKRATIAHGVCRVLSSRPTLGLCSLMIWTPLVCFSVLRCSQIPVRVGVASSQVSVWVKRVRWRGERRAKAEGTARRLSDVDRARRVREWDEGGRQGKAQSHLAQTPLRSGGEGSSSRPRLLAPHFRAPLRILAPRAPPCRAALPPPTPSCCPRQYKRARAKPTEQLVKRRSPGNR